MEDLTFGEQVKIVLGRKGMTIKRLAELIELRTGKKMSRQNLTQRLGRDNFQEQDMRLIAEILGCPFRLSILSGEMQPQEKAAVQLGRAVKDEEPASVSVQDTGVKSSSGDGLYAENGLYAEETGEEAYGETDYAEEMPESDPYEERAQTVSVESSGSDERDMTIGELYEIHEELSELEENARAGEPVEAIKEELEKPRKERFSFFRRRHTAEQSRGEQAGENEAVKNETDRAELKEESRADTYEESGSAYEEKESRYGQGESQEKTYAAGKNTDDQDFEPVISHNDVEEDTKAGEINPYTGREYQSNSVRMHPSRIGYVQVYDRSIHKWTDMTEWAFLGYQERKKALLGKAYEPPIYLD